MLRADSYLDLYLLVGIGTVTYGVHLLFVVLDVGVVVFVGCVYVGALSEAVYVGGTETNAYIELA